MRVLITGANRGIGKEMAAQYTARGDEVIGTSRDGSAGLALDVTDPASVAAAARQTGPVDLLVCNAGVYLDKGHDLQTGFGPDLWEQSFAANVTGVFATIQAFLPNLKAADRGRIAVIASRMGSNTESTSGGSYIYRASKAAAINLTVNLARDLEEHGIFANAYHPGWVRTQMGGGAADIDAATSAAGLIARFDLIGPGHTGRFETYDGTPLAV